MSVLWLAFGIYIFGVALVLYLRPTNMFRPGAGTWKEFGLNTTGNYTIFPFWMFTLIWAVLSYVFATMGMMFMASLALPKEIENNIALNIKPISASSNNFLPAATATTATTATTAAAAAAASPQAPAAKIPGYYILQPSMNGMPQYVYFGSEPPTLQNIASA